MGRYLVQNRNITSSLFKDVEKKIEDEIQPFLDEGARYGYQLHSFQATAASKGINLVFIWFDPAGHPPPA